MTKTKVARLIGNNPFIAAHSQQLHRIAKSLQGLRSANPASELKQRQASLRFAAAHFEVVGAFGDQEVYLLPKPVALSFYAIDQDLLLSILTETIQLLESRTGASIRREEAVQSLRAAKSEIVAAYPELIKPVIEVSAGNSTVEF